MSAFTVRAGGEKQYIYGKKFEDYGKAKIKFYLDGVDNKEWVCITNERHDFDTCDI